MPSPIAIGFEVEGDSAEVDAAAVRVGQLVAFALDRRGLLHGPWQVVRVDAGGPQPYYRLDVIPRAARGPTRLKSAILGALAEIAALSPEELERRASEARAAGVPEVPLAHATESVAGPGLLRAAPPPPPGTTGARLVRYERARRRWRLRNVAVAVVLAGLLAGGFVLWDPLHPSPGSGASGGGPGGGGGGSTGSSVAVDLGTPTWGSIDCAKNQTVTAERIPWTGASATLATAEFGLRVKEITDNDVVGSSQVTPAATTTNDCSGAPPAGNYDWYAVLANPSGTNVAVYSYAAAWSPVGGAASSVPVTNGSSLTLIMVPSVAGQGGYELFLLGAEGGPTVTGSVVL